MHRRRAFPHCRVALWAALASCCAFASSLAGADAEPVVAQPDAGAPALHPEVIVQPPTLGTLSTGLTDVNGSPIGIECATCHEPENPAAFAILSDAPDDLHAGIALEHGTLVCNSCHAHEDRTRLQLAAGDTLPMREVVRLCAQCHGTQYRSFRNSAHGGARGHWDLSRGPRYRNSCIACHAAHRPAYPTVRPMPPPRDRFLPTAHRVEGAGAAEEAAAHAE